MRIVTENSERVDLTYAELIDGEVYQTNGGSGMSDPDGMHYLKLADGNGIAELERGYVYSETDYDLTQWVYWAVDAELLVD